MKNLLAFCLLIAAFLCSCNPKNNTQLSHLNNLKQVDALLSEIREPAQTFEVPFDKPSIVTGKNGTIIHVDPSKLKSVFGYPLQASIEVELIEMHDEGSMITQLAPTTSNGRILDSGGAYYLNMKSAGQQLEIRKGEGLEVEFPKLSKGEMSLFWGERDSMGNINWVQAEQKFEKKVPPKLEKPRKTGTKKTNNPLDDLFDYIEDNSDPISQEERDDWEKDKARWENENKTFEAIKVMNLGWINCDRFLNDFSPKTNIALTLGQKQNARFYLIFKDINSVISHSSNRGNSFSFAQIPINRELVLIGLAADEKSSYMFEKEFTSAFDQEIEVTFAPATKDEIKAKLSALK